MTSSATLQHQRKASPTVAHSINQATNVLSRQSRLKSGQILRLAVVSVHMHPPNLDLALILLDLAGQLQSCLAETEEHNPYCTACP